MQRVGHLSANTKKAGGTPLFEQGSLLSCKDDILHWLTNLRLDFVKLLKRRLQFRLRILELFARFLQLGFALLVSLHLFMALPGSLKLRPSLLKLSLCLLMLTSHLLKLRLVVGWGTIPHCERLILLKRMLFDWTRWLSFRFARCGDS